MRNKPIEKAAKDYISLKNRIAKLEKKKEEMGDVLKPWLFTQKDQTAELHGWKFSLVETERENFKLSAAKEKIDGRTLAPFITTSKFTQIRTVFKGLEDEKAA